VNRHLLRLGFILILLALFTGLAIPSFANPRLGLAAHVAGITSALVLIAVGALATSFALGTRATRVMNWSWVYAAYANWFACLVGAITGASRLTPIAGAGTTGSSVAEGVVTFLLLSLSLAAIAGTSLAVWGLRRRELVPSTGPVAAAA
jgi:(hydroxyamino)benzene mutase